ncbi:UPF0158 family protein [Pseudarthrobacter sp. P1]|uniref:UPF0158 family protein n=1 Tax=Pseudarthrobacter sp. P1 TaxID=3418418 RepID=UPI003CE6B00E
MLTLDNIDLDDLAMALEFQTDYESFWWLDPATGEIGFWSEVVEDDTDESADDLDDRGVIRIDPTPSYEGFAEMESFVASLADPGAVQRLRAALQARHPFRRFKDTLVDFPDLRQQWHTFHDHAMRLRCVQWLVEAGVVDSSAAPGQVHPH